MPDEPSQDHDLEHCFIDENTDALVLDAMLNTWTSAWTMQEIATFLDGDEDTARKAVIKLTALGLADRCEDLVFPSLTLRHANELPPEGL